MTRPIAALAALSLVFVLGNGCTAPAARPRPTASTTPIAGSPANPDAPTSAELDLLAQLNAYRESHDLPPLRLSRSLAKVARTHARDLSAHGFTDACNIHSWSSAGPWSSCCYRSDHSEARCMWNKPREMTAYDGTGYEIGYWFSAGVRTDRVLAAWKKSPIHDAVLRNTGTWARRTWRALGLAIDGDYAIAWFGEDDDPAGYWK